MSRPARTVTLLPGDRLSGAETSIRLRRQLRRSASEAAVNFWLVGIFLITYLYFVPAPNDLNARARIDTTIALVNHHSFAIDQYAWNTGDLAFAHDHWYSNKVPGQSVLGVPILLALKGAMTLTGHGQAVTDMGTRRSVQGGGLLPYYALMYVMTVITVTLPAIWMLSLFFWFLGLFSTSARNRAILTLGLGLGTSVLPYANDVYSHVPAAALEFTSFVLLYLLAHPSSPPPGRFRRLPARPRLAAFLAGLLAGLGVFLEYPAAVPLAVLGIYAWWALPRRRGVMFALGAAVGPALVLLCAYLAYGNVLATGYTQHNYYAPLQNRGIGGFTWPPAANALWGLTFSPYRGVFFLSPFLLLSLPGAVIMLRRRRPEGLAVVAVPVILVTVIAMFAYWNGGGDTVGPRLLILCLPFLALPAIMVMERFRGTASRSAMYALFLVSGAAVWIESLGTTGNPPYTHNPLFVSSIPALERGEVTLSLGAIVLAPFGGFHSLWSLIFLPPALALWTTLRVVKFRRSFHASARPPGARSHERTPLDHRSSHLTHAE